jgi:cytochrome c biogenesis protein CcmG, thiol:disulfide interchange protein DsbE
MRGKLFWAQILFLSLAGLAALFIYGLWRDTDNNFVRSQLIGQRLPAFSLPSALPETQGISNIDMAKGGKPRMLNLFGSWCIPCAVESKQLEILRAQGVEIYGIALRDTPDALGAFLAQYGNPFARIGADPEMKTQLLMGSTGVPETFVIGSDGTIVYQHIGEIRAEDVPVLLAKLRAAK